MNKIEEAFSKIEREQSAEYFSELLMDTDVTTWKMFEELASEYLSGSEDKKRGIDLAVMILTGWSLETISQNMLERYA